MNGPPPPQSHRGPFERLAEVDDQGLNLTEKSKFSPLVYEYTTNIVLKN